MVRSSLSLDVSINFLCMYQKTPCFKDIDKSILLKLRNNFLCLLCLVWLGFGGVGLSGGGWGVGWCGRGDAKSLACQTQLQLSLS